MKKLFFVLAIVLPIMVTAQLRIIDTAQQIVIGQVERVIPIGSVTLTQYIKNDTTFTLAYKSEGAVDMSTSVSFKAGSTEIEALYNALSSVLVDNRAMTVTLVLGSTPITVSNYVKANVIKCDVKIKGSNFYLTKDQLKKLFSK